jgi:hypothetical protein
MTRIADDVPLMTFVIRVGPAVDVGTVAGLHRRCFPLVEGTVEGGFRGVLLPGGTDWQTVQPNGTVEVSARYMLGLEQGVVEVRSEGMRTGDAAVLRRLAAGEPVAAERYYFRTAIRFFTASQELDRLNRLLAVGVGERFPDAVRLAVFPVL